MTELPLEISCQDVHSLLNSPAADFLLLDCREPDEHATVHIAGATLIPMSQFAARAGELDPHKHARLVIHCHHGGRSLRVARWLREQGFDKAQSMAGGIDQWAVEIDPTLPRY